MTYFAKNSICQICGKHVGGCKPTDHSRCSRKLQQIHLNTKRKKAAPKTLSAKQGDALVRLISRKAE